MSHRPPGARTVSVVVPLYNGAEHIAETLTSIQLQSSPATQVIVVDDGSSDDGAAIARAHPVGATVVSQPNLGVAVARNHGLSIASGEWVAFLDQDDLWHPDHLRRTIAWLDEHPAERIVFVGEIAFSAVADSARLRELDDLAGGWASVRVSGSDALDELVARADAADEERVETYDVHALLRGPISMTTSFVADADLLRRAGGFAPHALAMDDYWLMVNVARLTPIAKLVRPTVFYRVHSDATSRTTRLGLPFLSSAAALRLGGGIIPLAEGLRGELSGGLHRHLLLELRTAPEYRDRRFRAAVDHLEQIVWPPNGRPGERLRAHAAMRWPWLRELARRLRRGRSR